VRVKKKDEKKKGHTEREERKTSKGEKEEMNEWMNG